MVKVLLVDDSPIDRVLIEGLLKSEANVQVVSVADPHEALACIGSVRPQAVITDLNMPNMNGLQLITELRVRHPSIPVLLITANGNEQTAWEALELGAASYVPKTHLHSKLIDTLRHVLALSHEYQSYQRLTQCLDLAQFRFHLKDDDSLHERLVELLLQMCVSMDVCSSADQVRLGTAIEEALAYMHYRGNYELNDDQLRQVSIRTEAGLELLARLRQDPKFSERLLTVEYSITPELANITIRHAGPARQPPELPNRETASHPEHHYHRGLILMTSLLDEVVFSSDSREVRLLQRSTRE